MKKINLMNNALTLVSNLKASDVETVAAQDCTALCIQEPLERGGTEVVFSIAYDKKSQFGSITNRGIVFPGVNKEGFLNVTVLTPANGIDTKDYIYNTYAVAINNLNIIEAKVAESMKSRVKTKTTFLQGVSVLDDNDSEEIDMIADEPKPSAKKKKTEVATPVTAE